MAWAQQLYGIGHGLCASALPHSLMDGIIIKGMYTLTMECVHTLHYMDCGLHALDKAATNRQHQLRSSCILHSFCMYGKSHHTMVYNIIQGLQGASAKLVALRESDMGQ
uniref:Uncharacterized protein n=1 Tax=Solanum lycopersicum TaxID=4081 RepID=A0A3Q7I0U2_SOLLC